MRKTFIILFLSSWVFAATGSVSGTISSDRLGLPGANVSLIGSNLGAVTDSVGNYYLTGIPTGKYLLRVDYIGYETQTKEIYITLYDLDEKDETGSILVDKMGIDVELEESKDILKGNALKNVNFELISSALGLDEVVVSAAKKKQKITDAPATISTLNQVSIRRQVGVSAFTRLVTMLKGVDVSYYGVLMVRKSMPEDFLACLVQDLNNIMTALIWRNCSRVNYIHPSHHHQKSPFQKLKLYLALNHLSMAQMPQRVCSTLFIKTLERIRIMK